MSNDPSIFRFRDIPSLVELNKEWSQRLSALRPGLFPALGEGQHPEILWIGCSDSRVPETSLLDLLPGEVFVHRNIANVVPTGDISSLAVIQYAVEVLKVKHVIVCGHSCCGGVQASLEQKSHGLVDLWLQNVRDVRAAHRDELKAITDKAQRVQRLVELNVIAQVNAVRRNLIVAEAIEERELEIHGFVHDVGKGTVKILELPKDPHADIYALR